MPPDQALLHQAVSQEAAQEESQAQELLKKVTLIPDPALHLDSLAAAAPHPRLELAIILALQQASRALK